MNFVISLHPRIITNNNKLKRIKNVLKSIILLEFVFSDIINGYCKTFMAINAVTDLQDHLKIIIV